MAPSPGSCMSHSGSGPISWTLVTWLHLAAREAGTSSWVGGPVPRSKGAVIKEKRVKGTWGQPTTHSTARPWGRLLPPALCLPHSEHTLPLRWDTALISLARPVSGDVQDLWVM